MKKFLDFVWLIESFQETRCRIKVWRYREKGNSVQMMTIFEASTKTSKNCMIFHSDKWWTDQ